MLSGKSSIGDPSAWNVEMFWVCIGTKGDELSLLHNEDTLSVPAVTLENGTQRLLKRGGLSQQVKVTFIQKILKSQYLRWFSASLGMLVQQQDLPFTLPPPLNQHYSPLNHGIKTPAQTWRQAPTPLPKLQDCDKNLTGQSRSVG